MLTTGRVGLVSVLPSVMMLGERGESPASRESGINHNHWNWARGDSLSPDQRQNTHTPHHYTLNTLPRISANMSQEAVFGANLLFAKQICKL